MAQGARTRPASRRAAAGAHISGPPVVRPELPVRRLPPLMSGRTLGSDHQRPAQPHVADADGTRRPARRRVLRRRASGPAAPTGLGSGRHLAGASSAADTCASRPGALRSLHRAVGPAQRRACGAHGQRAVRGPCPLAGVAWRRPLLICLVGACTRPGARARDLFLGVATKERSSVGRSEERRCSARLQ
jgi:hypothetical protein